MAIFIGISLASNVEMTLTICASCSDAPVRVQSHVMNHEEAYQGALEYLYSHVDFSLVRGFRYNPDQFDLGRMYLLMEKLGNPEKEYPIIHVAGTKGKGSVSALCASALRQAGYKVGLYTSPHLHDYAERIQVDGHPIDHADLVSLLEEMKPAIEFDPGLDYL